MGQVGPLKVIGETLKVESAKIGTKISATDVDPSSQAPGSVTWNAPSVGCAKKIRPGRTRGFYAAIVAVAVAFVLTACGARIDTTMKVSDTGGGERAMVLSLGQSDLSKLTGGVPAADASIRRHLPASLTYTGLQPASGGGVTATLTLAFDSTADYKKKAADILRAGGASAASIDFAVSDSVLVKGITLRENHTSADLMKWMFTGLVSDGVLSSGDLSNAYELGTSSVTFAGITTQQSNTLNVKNVQNSGFDAVTMQTQIQDTNHITRMITYTVNDARYNINKDVQEKFISGATPDGAKVATPSNGTWTMSFSGDAAAIASATTKALGGGAAKFELALSDASDDPSEKVLTVSEAASCDAVCFNSTSIIDTLTTTSGYTPRNADLDISRQASTRFTYAPPITSVLASFNFGIDGSVNANVDFVIPKASTDAVGDGFSKKLDPGKDLGTLSSAPNESNTKYSVAITGKNTEEFATKFKKWAPGSTVVTDDKGDGLFLHKAVYNVRPTLQKLIGRHAVTEGATSEIVLPFGQWVTNSGIGSEQAADLGGVRVKASGLESPLTVQSTGPTAGGLVTAALLLAALILGVVLLVRNRGAVMATLTSLGARFGGGPTEQRLLPFEANAVGQHHSTGRSVLDLAGPDDGARRQQGGSVFDVPEAGAAAPRPSEPETRPSLLG